MVWVDGDVMVVFFFNFGAVFHAVGHWLVYWLSCVAGVWLFLMGDAFAASSHQRFGFNIFGSQIAQEARSWMRHQVFNFATVVVKQVAELQVFFGLGVCWIGFFFFNILPTFSEVYLESTSPQNLPWICPEASWNPKLFLWGRIESQRNPGNPKPWERRQSVLDQVACRSCRAASRCWGFLTKWIFGYLG